MFTLPESMLVSLRLQMNQAYRMEEEQCIHELMARLTFSSEEKNRIANLAEQLVKGIRERRLSQRGLDSFLHEYDLSTEEGITLMCLAEALLRIPDAENRDKLIKDKITKADWETKLGKSDSLFVNAATWGLMLTGKILSGSKTNANSLTKVFRKLLEKSGEPLIRTAISQAMRILGKQFVMGQTISEALTRAGKYEEMGYRFSYDMLGEGAKTAKDAERYFQAYQASILEIQKSAKSSSLYQNPGISVKLSALYPRYELAKYEKAELAITEKLLKLAELCQKANIPLTVDAEEAERLDISLNIIEKVFTHPNLKNWHGFGLAVQSYQKRAYYLLDWLIALAKTTQKRMMVRLIKGAYWDSEIKNSQEKGLPDYPVFTRKASTDISFLACARKILENTDVLYPMFATHNAQTVASIFEMAGSYRDFEFQCLHGMGASLYDQVTPRTTMNRPCRIYAPVGSHEELLPYLVRRLLENGANSSFVNRISDTSLPIKDLIEDPVDIIKSYKSIAHPKIPLPRQLYSERLNSLGVDLTDSNVLLELQQSLSTYAEKTYEAKPTFISKALIGQGNAIYNPARKHELVGWVSEASADDVEKALTIAKTFFLEWTETDLTIRASYLEKAADLLEQHMEELLCLLIREAGKTIYDAVAEVREAIDFCRYYAQIAKTSLTAIELKGYTGETDHLYYIGRGPMVCISPWNFPLAIFTGQIMAALVAGNPVLAKPAEQTPLIAARAVELFHQAGIPKEALQLLPGTGEIVGSGLVRDVRTKGVLFTGSNETANLIYLTLAKRGGPIVPFIAETGGQNAMIVDSSALPEQVVQDVLNSAFYSAGQRCSALRVLFVQEEISDKVIEMLKGSMDELYIDDPRFLTTDIGPVIDAEALTKLEKHADYLEQIGSFLHRAPLLPSTKNGTFFAPRAYEISAIDQLHQEVFGPILHIIRYKTKDLEKIIESINNTGYGLTFGIHSRISETVKAVIAKVHAGNIYVNRNMIGAIVGVQPFGGEGLSGTGPKAGGPNYLLRLVSEKTICINTTAAGGNASLMAMKEFD